jgi:membrane protein YqaA with SNARE-associated domain
MSEKSTFKKILPIIPLLFGFILTGFFLVYVSPDSLINYIGINNAYFLMFAVAALSGLSTFNSVPYYAILLVLANAGVNPFFLGTASALGVMSGDSFSYFIGRQGSAVIPKILRPVFRKINSWAVNFPRMFPLVCFVYGAICPLSNDFITISSGIAKIAFARVMIPLALGNIIFNITLAYLVQHAFWLVSGLF